jgi:hypothetical protein
VGADAASAALRQRSPRSPDLREDLVTSRTAPQLGTGGSYREKIVGPWPSNPPCQYKRADPPATTLQPSMGSIHRQLLRLQRYVSC